MNKIYHLNPLTNLLLPKHCLVCHEATKGSAVCKYCLPKTIIDFDCRCEICFAELPFLDNQKICLPCSYYKSPFNKARYIWDYTGQSRNFIRTMKYKSLVTLVNLSASAITKYWPILFKESDFDIIIPMPANYLRHKIRGFNQSLLIANYLKKSLNFNQKKVYDLLKAPIKRKAQADLSTAARIKNMKSGFRCRRSYLVYNKNILLIDDVITTGASIRAGIACLKANGANKIEVLSLAVSPAFYRNRQNFCDNN